MSSQTRQVSAPIVIDTLGLLAGYRSPAFFTLESSLYTLPASVKIMSKNNQEDNVERERDHLGIGPCLQLLDPYFSIKRERERQRDRETEKERDETEEREKERSKKAVLQFLLRWL